jgi:hypothetical protein
LGIVKRIVESHGGVVEIRNNLSFPGVTAEIRLPVIEAAVMRGFESVFDYRRDFLCVPPDGT